jgi:uncharacterized protein (DUF4415 family)
MEKTKFKTGKVSRIPEDEFEPKNMKVRISMFIDGDVLESAKETAKHRGDIGYQTLINQKLREVFLNEETVEDRLARLEKIVLKKRA